MAEYNRESDEEKDVKQVTAEDRRDFERAKEKDDREAKKEKVMQDGAREGVGNKLRNLIMQAGGEERKIADVTQKKMEQGKVTEAQALVESCGKDSSNAVHVRLAQAFLDRGGSMEKLSDLYQAMTPVMEEEMKGMIVLDPTMFTLKHLNAYEKGQNWDTVKGEWSWQRQLGLEGQSEFYDMLQRSGVLEKYVRDGKRFDSYQPHQLAYAVAHKDEREFKTPGFFDQLSSMEQGQEYFQGQMTGKLKEHGIDTSTEQGKKMARLLGDLDSRRLRVSVPLVQLEGHQLQHLYDHVGELDQRMMDAIATMPKDAVWMPKERVFSRAHIDHRLNFENPLHVQAFSLFGNAESLKPLGEFTDEQLDYLIQNPQKATEISGELKDYEPGKVWDGEQFHEDFVKYGVERGGEGQKRVYDTLKAQNRLDDLKVSIHSLTSQQRNRLLSADALSKGAVSNIQYLSDTLPDFCERRRRYVGDIESQQLDGCSQQALAVYDELDRLGLRKFLKKPFGSLREDQIGLIGVEMVKGTLDSRMIEKIGDMKLGDVYQNGRFETPKDSLGSENRLERKVEKKLGDLGVALRVELKDLAPYQLEYLRKTKELDKDVVSSVHTMEKEEQEWNGKEFVDSQDRKHSVGGQLSALRGVSSADRLCAERIALFELDYALEDLKDHQKKYLRSVGLDTLDRGFLEELPFMSEGTQWNADAQVFVSKSVDLDDPYSEAKRGELRRDFLHAFPGDQYFSRLLSEHCPQFMEGLLQAHKGGASLEAALSLQWSADSSLAADFFKGLSESFPLQNLFGKFVEDKPELQGLIRGAQENGLYSEVYSLTCQKQMFGDGEVSVQLDEPVVFEEDVVGLEIEKDAVDEGDAEDVPGISVEEDEIVEELEYQDEVIDLVMTDREDEEFDESEEDDVDAIIEDLVEIEEAVDEDMVVIDSGHQEKIEDIVEDEADDIKEAEDQLEGQEESDVLGVTGDDVLEDQIDLGEGDKEIRKEETDDFIAEADDEEVDHDRGRVLEDIVSEDEESDVDVFLKEDEVLDESVENEDGVLEEEDDIMPCREDQLEAPLSSGVQEIEEQEVEASFAQVEKEQQKEVKEDLILKDRRERKERQKRLWEDLLRDLSIYQVRIIGQSVDMLVREKGVKEVNEILALILGAAYEDWKKRRRELLDKLKLLIQAVLDGHASLEVFEELIASGELVGVRGIPEIESLMEEAKKKLKDSLRSNES